jgi:NAD(P)H-dependent flavin oxidoreductase YrpB (nitropropane dioxygenase family)
MLQARLTEMFSVRYAIVSAGMASVPAQPTWLQRSSCITLSRSR